MNASSESGECASLISMTCVTACLVAIAYLLWAWLGQPAPVRIPCELAVAGGFTKKGRDEKRIPPARVIRGKATVERDLLTGPEGPHTAINQWSVTQPACFAKRLFPACG